MPAALDPGGNHCQRKERQNGRFRDVPTGITVRARTARCQNQTRHRGGRVLNARGPSGMVRVDEAPHAFTPSIARQAQSFSADDGQLE
jgi:protein subunit release factor A